MKSKSVKIVLIILLIIILAGGGAYFWHKHQSDRQAAAKQKATSTSKAKSKGPTSPPNLKKSAVKRSDQPLTPEQYNSATGSTTIPSQAPTKK